MMVNEGSSKLGKSGQSTDGSDKEEETNIEKTLVETPGPNGRIGQMSFV